LRRYEIELGADGELLAYRRTRRYRRGQTFNAETDGELADTDGELAK